MADVKINDLNLLRYCYARTVGRDVEELKNSFPSDKCVCFGEYRSDGDPLWAVNLYDFKHNHDCKADIVMNVKGLFTTSLFSRIARVIFNYVFCQAKLARCSLQIRASNAKSLRLVRAWGFKEEGCKRHGYVFPKVEDMVLFGMLKDDCRWI